MFVINGTFSSGLEIFSTFNIHQQPVYCCLIHVRFNLTDSTFLTIALAGPVPADKRHLAEKKGSKYLKKNYFKNRQPYFIGDDY